MSGPNETDSSCERRFASPFSSNAKGTITSTLAMTLSPSMPCVRRIMAQMPRGRKGARHLPACRKRSPRQSSVTTAPLAADSPAASTVRTTSLPSSGVITWGRLPSRTHCAK